MPSNIEELYVNATGLSWSDLSGAGTNIVTNAAGERASFQQFEIDFVDSAGASAAPPNAISMKIGDWEIQSITAARYNLKVDRVEYMGPSKSLVVSIGDDEELFTDFQQVKGNILYDYQTGVPVRKALSEVLTSSVAVSNMLDTNTAVEGADSGASLLISSQPSFWFHYNGNFYYSNEGTTTLYKRTGGISGAQTALTGHGGCCWAYDGARYVYSIASSTQNYYKYDLQTETFVFSAQAVNVGAAVVATYSVGAYATPSGFYLPRPSYNHAIYIVDSSDHSSHPTSRGSNSNPSRYPYALVQLSGGDYLLAAAESNNGALACTNIGSDLANPSYSYTIGVSNMTTVFSGWNPGGGAGSNNFRPIPGKPGYMFAHYATNTGAIVDLNGLQAGGDSLIRAVAFNDNQMGAVGGGFIQPQAVTANLSDASYGKLKLRVQGIKVTA